ncbi:hypothetical protein JI664_16300 [Rhodobacter sp. NTK016B]|uniref:COG4223 family protein n=1 Tax=Rhodobacter sp. NTK016B TaxID=2759676 RepID=UPI001A9081F1|nr:mitofilin family membrane protein [Rhodobacter sp. NTK016B]MBN8293534.1 hypothetical protein [Rhodobacter sp. NTK016B]
MARNTRSRPKAETPGGKAEAIDDTDGTGADTAPATPSSPGTAKGSAKGSAKNTSKSAGTKSGARSKTAAARSSSDSVTSANAEDDTTGPELAPTPETPPAKTPDLIEGVEDTQEASAPADAAEPPVSAADPALTASDDSAAPARLPAGTPAPGGDPRKPGVTMTPAETATAPSVESTGHTPPPAPPAAPASSGGGGAMPMILGGFVAAALGALAVLIFLPNGWQGGTDNSDLAERVSALETRSTGLTASDLQPLEDRVAALESELESDQGAIVDLSPLQDRVTALESQESDGVSEEAMNTAIGALTSQLAELEASIDSRIDSAVSTATADAEAALQQRADTVEAQAEDVEARQARTVARGALAELTAASESGEPAPDALTRLQDAIGDAVPEPLNAMADGITPLATLQDDFSVAARAALAAQPIPENASLGERVSEFFRAQTGARSLAPRPGDDVDAVLSRAEAALRQGDITGTLSELDTLTGDPAAEMAQWRAKAETRLSVLQALDDVRAQLDRDEE